jgi:hypothetical protein
MTEPAKPPGILEFQDLSNAISDLANRIIAAKKAIRAAGGPAAQLEYRLAEPVDLLKEAGKDVDEFVADLKRIAAVPTDACNLEGGACPEHGKLLRSSGGRTWCRVPTCKNRWSFEYDLLPCPQPIEYLVTGPGEDGEPIVMRMCRGHAYSARHIEGVTIDPPLPADVVRKLELVESADKVLVGINSRQLDWDWEA